MIEIDRLEAMLGKRQRLPRNHLLAKQRNLMTISRRAPESSNNLRVRNVGLTGVEPAEGLLRESVPLVGRDEPWTAFTTHAQFDDYVKEHKIQLPEIWETLTLAKKRDWLSK